MSVKESVYIEAPVEKVFEFYADPRKSWSAGPEQMTKNAELLDVKMTDEGVGTYYSWVMKFAGLRVEGFDLYTEYVLNKRFTDRSSFALAGTWTFEVEPEGTGTRLTGWRHPVSVRALQPLDGLMDRFRVSIIRQSLEKVKAELEKPAATAPATSGQRGAP